MCALVVGERRPPDLEAKRRVPPATASETARSNVASPFQRAVRPSARSRNGPSRSRSGPGEKRSTSIAWPDPPHLRSGEWKARAVDAEDDIDNASSLRAGSARRASACTRAASGTRRMRAAGAASKRELRDHVDEHCVRTRRVTRSAIARTASRDPASRGRRRFELPTFAGTPSHSTSRATIASSSTRSASAPTRSTVCARAG